MNTKFRSFASVLVLSAVGLGLVAGCGGGGSSSGSSSQARGGSFASGAEAACASANKQIVALGTPQQEEVVKYMLATEKVIEELDRKVHALDEGGSSETAYAEGLAESLTVLTQMSNAARSENFDAVRELSGKLVKIHLGELAEKAELKACAEVPGAKS